MVYLPSWSRIIRLVGGNYRQIRPEYERNRLEYQLHLPQVQQPRPQRRHLQPTTSTLDTLDLVDLTTSNRISRTRSTTKRATRTPLALAHTLAKSPCPQTPFEMIEFPTSTRSSSTTTSKLIQNKQATKLIQNKQRSSPPNQKPSRLSSPKRRRSTESRTRTQQMSPIPRANLAADPLVPSVSSSVSAPCSASKD